MNERERLHYLADPRNTTIPASAFNPVTNVIEVKELLEEALSIDGVRHKQWYLWRIAEALSIELPDDLVDKGIAP